MKKLGVFIPGRLKSERLPNKLILPLGDTCLWEIACKKLNELPECYDKYALCYDEELINIAKKYKNVKIVVRDKKTAEVDGPLSFIFKELKDVESTHLMFLNPCLYNLSVQTIEDNLIKFEKENMDYATSVKPIKNWIFNSEGKIANSIDYEKLNTKLIEPWYVTAHCFHVFNKDNFFMDNMMLKDGHGLLEVGADETLDVDDYSEYKYAKWFVDNI